MDTPAMIGKGDCHRCNMLADHINNLTVQAEITEACHCAVVERMQAQIDALIQEKKTNLCRCEGFNTKGIGE